jgi:hypothetical protein
MIYLKGTQYVVDAAKKGSILRFVNHSNIANCTVQTWYRGSEQVVYYVANRRIVAGEFLSIDYGDHFWQGTAFTTVSLTHKLLSREKKCLTVDRVKGGWMRSKWLRDKIVVTTALDTDSIGNIDRIDWSEEEATHRDSLCNRSKVKFVRGHAVDGGLGIGISIPDKPARSTVKISKWDNRMKELANMILRAERETEASKHSTLTRLLKSAPMALYNIMKKPDPALYTGTRGDGLCTYRLAYQLWSRQLLDVACPGVNNWNSVTTLQAIDPTKNEHEPFFEFISTAFKYLPVQAKSPINFDVMKQFHKRGASQPSKDTWGNVSTIWSLSQQYESEQRAGMVILVPYLRQEWDKEDPLHHLIAVAGTRTHDAEGCLDDATDTAGLTCSAPCMFTWKQLTDVTKDPVYGVIRDNHAHFLPTPTAKEEARRLEEALDDLARDLLEWSDSLRKKQASKTPLGRKPKVLDLVTKSRRHDVDGPPVRFSQSSNKYLEVTNKSKVYEIE